MADLTRLALLFRRAGAVFRPADLLDAFADAVGPSGNVLVPTYTFDLEDGAAFDVRRSGSISGVLAMAALAHPRFMRTPHPLHSFAVCGADAAVLAASTEKGSFGPASPFAFLRTRKARLIAIDLRLDDALTYVHHVEECVGVPYRKQRTMRFAYTDAIGVAGRSAFTIYTKRPGHHMRFEGLDRALHDAGAAQVLALDGTKVLVVDLGAAHAVIERDIRANAARGIHEFRWSWWTRDVLKGLRYPAGKGPHRPCCWYTLNALHREAPMSSGMCSSVCWASRRSGCTMRRSSTRRKGHD
jgi:aminoglycoside N3'-acetyltransferase